MNKMFSIESLLNEIIEFLRKFIHTFFNVLFSPKEVLKNLFISDFSKLILPRIFFVLSCLTYYSVQNVYASLPREYLNGKETQFTWQSFYIDLVQVSVVEKIILSIIPVGVLYMTTIFLAKILSLTKPQKETYIGFALYWIGVWLIFNGLLNLTCGSVYAFVNQNYTSWHWSHLNLANWLIYYGPIYGVKSLCIILILVSAVRYFRPENLLVVKFATTALIVYFSTAIFATCFKFEKEYFTYQKPVEPELEIPGISLFNCDSLQSEYSVELNRKGIGLNLIKSGQSNDKTHFSLRICLVNNGNFSKYISNKIKLYFSSDKSRIYIFNSTDRVVIFSKANVEEHFTELKPYSVSELLLQATILSNDSLIRIIDKDVYDLQVSVLETGYMTQMKQPSGEYNFNVALHLSEP